MIKTDVTISGGGYIASFRSDLGGNCYRLIHEISGSDILRTPRDESELFSSVFLFGNAILFPPNRVRGGSFEFGGKTYKFPINEPKTGCHLHGELYKTPFKIKEQSDSSVTFEYKAEAGEYLGFPHAFSVLRKYELSELWRGTVLDCVSAHILTERGVDVGIASCGATVTKRVSFLQTEAEGMKAFVSSGEIRTPDAVELQSSAHVLMTYPEDGENRPLAYTYENARGERFLVFLFDGDSQFRVAEKNPSRIFESYATQNTLLKALPWVARQPLPAYCEKNPHLYMICKKSDASLSVALFNCFADYVTNPVITLGESYSEIECFGCEAELDGNKVTLKSRLHGFDFAAFRVFQ